MPGARKRLAVGQVWILHDRTQPQTFYRFQIIWHGLWEDQSYFVALKCGVQPDSWQVIVLDAQGIPHPVGSPYDTFVCERLSRSQSTRLVPGMEA